MNSSQQKVALFSGQYGSYLAEFLLEKGYIVHAINRRASLFNTQRIDHIYKDPHIEHANFKQLYGDLSDTSNLICIVQETQPDEIYNLGALSHVAVSFESFRLLESIRILGMEKKNPLLPSLYVRVAWLGARNSAKRNHDLLHSQPFRRSEDVCVLDRRELPRGQ